MPAGGSGKAQPLRRLAGNDCSDGDVPIREDWIYGAGGAGDVAGFTLPASGVPGIPADTAPAFYPNIDFSAGAVKVYVRSVPGRLGSEFSLYVGTAIGPLTALTIAAGAKSVDLRPNRRVDGDLLPIRSSACNYGCRK
jgi:hypothetical protein